MSPLHVLVVGAAGRLGAVVAADFAADGHVVTPLTRAELDLESPDQIAATIARHRPHVVVNCAAYNAVDAAEAHPTTAFAINADAPRAMARAANEIGALLVHYSTDFVFDGEATMPYGEDDAPNPRSVYGASKRQGEIEAAQASRHYILRVESLFGGTGIHGHKTTIDYLADGIEAGAVVRALVDRTVSPSYVPDVLEATRQLVQQAAPFGIYHAVSTGHVTWFDLAGEIARQIGVTPRLEPVSAASFTAPAPRPRFCALANGKLSALGIAMPTWQSAVRRRLAVRDAQKIAADAVR